jgi:signal peptide peptidase SppA
MAGVVELPEIRLAADARGGVPHLGEYFSTWAIREDEGINLSQLARNLDLAAHLAARQQNPPRQSGYDDSRGGGGRGYQLQNGTAFIVLSGPLMKHASSLSDGTSTVEARRAIRAAVNDDAVTNICVVFDSCPGGTAAGTEDLADDVAWAAKRKPTYAQVNDLCASAGYWIASQCEKIFATPSSLVGSIGTYMVVTDMSEAAAKEGIKVHVVRSAEFKGLGVPGSVVTDEHLEHVQQTVNDLNARFLKAVRTGRGLDASAVEQIADGRVHIAAKARSKGLIDGVQSLDDTLKQLRSQTKPGAGVRSSVDTLSQEDTIHMASEQLEHLGPARLAVSQLAIPAPTAAATIADLKRVCPGCDAAFQIEQLERGATAEMARDAWNQNLVAQLAAKDAQIAAKDAEIKELKSKAKADDEECDDDEDDDDDRDEMDEKKKGKAKSTKAKGGAKSAQRPGVAPISQRPPSDSHSSGDPAAEWKMAIAEKMKANPRMTHIQAAKAVNKEQPELRQAAVAQAN